MDGGVTLYIQRALDTGEHYPFDDKTPLDPSISVTIDDDGLKEIKEIKASAWDIMTFQVKGKGLIITVQKYETGCKKLYSLICTMCTTVTRNKIKGLKKFSPLKQLREILDNHSPV